MKIDSTIIVEDKSWKFEPYVQKRYIRSVIQQVLKHVEAFCNVKIVEVVLVLTNNDKMQQLNYEFLGKNKPTNVLSFPDVEIKTNDLLEFMHLRDYIYLGDIVMGYNVIKAEAEEANITMREHFIHLLVHGVLHLMGYDHIIDRDAEKMMTIEVEILRALNITSPY
jgi:probable rRNA maturation factor